MPGEIFHHDAPRLLGCVPALPQPGREVVGVHVNVPFLLDELREARSRPQFSGKAVLGRAVGEPTPGATAEAFVEMGVKRWPPVPVKRVASRPTASELPNTMPSSVLPELPLLSHETTGQQPPADSSRPRTMSMAPKVPCGTAGTGEPPTDVITTVGLTGFASGVGPTIRSAGGEALNCVCAEVSIDSRRMRPSLVPLLIRGESCYLADDGRVLGFEAVGA